jgi:putative transposase
MSRRPYSTDLADDQWAIVEPLLPPPRPRGRRPTVDRRRVLDATLYQTMNACVRRDLPRDFPNPTTVYRSTAGGGARPAATRTRRRGPSTAGASGRRRRRPSDPKKKAKGRKQHLCVDTEGLMLSVGVTAASADDKAAAYGLVARAAARNPRLKKLWADGAYMSGPLGEDAAGHGADFEVVGRPEGAPARGRAGPRVRGAG